jgi:hypothetical protein
MLSVGMHPTRKYAMAHGWACTWLAIGGEASPSSRPAGRFADKFTHFDSDRDLERDETLAHPGDGEPPRNRWFGQAAGAHMVSRPLGVKGALVGIHSVLRESLRWRHQRSLSGPNIASPSA